MEGFDNELLSEEEVEALKTVPPIDEPEPTSEEQKVDIKEPSTPEGEKKVEAEPKPKVEEPAKKVEEPVREPEPKEEKPPTIDGIIAKDGKNYIPFTVLEEERAAKKTALEDKQRLEAKVAELEKKAAEPPPKVEPPPAAEPPKQKVDLKALAKDFATNTYKSEEDAVLAAENLIKNIVDVVREEVKGTTEKAVRSSTEETEFKREAARIKSANPWITAGFVEEAIVNRALVLMSERKVDDLTGMVKASEDAVAEAKIQFRVNEPKIDLKAEREKMAKEIRDQVTKEILAKFNIKEPGPVTLSDVRNVSPDVLSKFDEIDKLSGIDYEEAVGQLKPEEREAYLKRGEAF